MQQRGWNVLGSRPVPSPPEACIALSRASPYVPPVMTRPIIFAIPKGRILDEALPLLARAGIEPEAEFHKKESRALKFATNVPGLSIIRVRAFDVATFVAHGAALGLRDLLAGLLEAFRAVILETAGT